MARVFDGDTPRTSVVQAAPRGQTDWSLQTPTQSKGSARILIGGSDLLSTSLARALETYGFAVMQVAPNTEEIERALEWRPDLVLIDVRSLDIATGSALIGNLRRVGFLVCVMDEADKRDRSAAWLRAGPSALVDKTESLNRLFQTIKRLLKLEASPSTAPPDSLALTSAGRQRREARPQLSIILTHREQVVLSELMDGYCAEEIAKKALVSISTVRSQIKAILQKLGVNSQLAAVAMARRAGWSLDCPPEKSTRSNSHRNRVS